MMHLRCQNAKFVGVGVLAGWKLAFRYHADIQYGIPAKDLVCGALWEIDHDDLLVIDQLENAPHYYKRIVFHVKYDFDLEDRYTVANAWVYTMADNKPRLCAPDPEYYNIIKEGYRQCDIPLGQLYQAHEESSRLY